MVEECVPQRERTTGDSRICPSKKSMSLNQENRYARKIRRDARVSFPYQTLSHSETKELGTTTTKRSTILRGGNMISIPSQGSANNTNSTLRHLRKDRNHHHQTETFSTLAMNPYHTHLSIIHTQVYLSGGPGSVTQCLHTADTQYNTQPQYQLKN